MAETNLGNVAVVPRGAWSDSVAYTKNSLVGNNGNMYLAMKDAPSGTLTTNTEYYMLAATKGLDGDVTSTAMNEAISYAINGVQEDIAAVESDIEGIQSDITTIESNLETANTSVRTVATGGTGQTTPAGIVTAIKSPLIDLIFRIGFVYQSTDPTSPATFYGGTWTAIRGKFLYAEDDTHAAGTTGGTETHSHKYGMIIPDYYGVVSGAADDTGAGVIDYSVSGDETTGTKTSISSRALQHITTTTMVTGAVGVKKSEGETESDSNMPPYEAIYMWVRTA